VSTAEHPRNPWAAFRRAELAAEQEFDDEPITRVDAPIGNHSKWDLIDLARRKQVTAAWEALDDTEGACRAVQEAIDAQYTKDGRPLTEFGRLLRLVRLAEQGHRGGRDAAEAHVAQMRSKEYDQVRTIRDALAHLSARGLTPEADKGCCDAQVIDLEGMRLTDEERAAGRKRAESSEGTVHSADSATQGDASTEGASTTHADVSGLNLPAEFWEARPSLKHIRQAAQARRACPDAVLGNLLAREGAYAVPADGVDLGVGHPSPLTCFVVAYGPPGGGKTTAARVAAELRPPSPALLAAGYRERPLGTGEGMVTAFMALRPDPADETGKTKTMQQVRDNVLFVMDEAEQLFKANARSGTTVMQTIRAMWSGVTVGQANASAERDRQLDAGAYSTGLVLNFQPDTIGPLFDPQETGGGTPHRFLFLSVTDPNAPAVRPEWPGELKVTRPQPVDDPTRIRSRAAAERAARIKDAGETAAVEPIVHPLVDAHIAEEIEARRLAVLRGQITIDEKDTHTTLVRGRVAAILARWDGRIEVTADDWALAGQVVETSGRVRDAAIEHGARRVAAANRHADNQHANRQAHAAVVTMRAVEDEQARRIARVASKLARKVWATDGGLDGRGVKNCLGSRDRDVKDEATEHAVDAGWVERVGTAGLKRGPAAPPDA
jgi:hypothetical protein